MQCHTCHHPADREGLIRLAQVAGRNPVRVAQFLFTWPQQTSCRPDGHPGGRRTRWEMQCMLPGSGESWGSGQIRPFMKLRRWPQIKPYLAWPWREDDGFQKTQSAQLSPSERKCRNPLKQMHCVAFSPYSVGVPSFVINHIKYKILENLWSIFA